MQLTLLRAKFCLWYNVKINDKLLQPLAEMREAYMKQLQITQRILECEENGWLDLLSKIDSITQNIIECPSATFQIKAALILWCDSVDMRSNALPPNEDSVMLQHPSMNHKETFGAEA